MVQLKLKSAALRTGSEVTGLIGAQKETHNPAC